MATFLRPLSYQYQWLYNTISRLAAIPVGGEKRFRQLALANITINPLKYKSVGGWDFILSALEQIENSLFTAIAY